MGYLGTYNPSDITFAINGFIVKDFAEGSFIEVTRNEKSFKQIRGIRGKHTRVASRDRSGTIILRLMQTSQDNELLSQVVNADEVNMSGKLSVIIKDNSGQSGFQFVNCYLEGNPDISYQGATTTSREWRIIFDSFAKYTVGGNKLPPVDILTGLF